MIIVCKQQHHGQGCTGQREVLEALHEAGITGLESINYAKKISISEISDVKRGLGRSSPQFIFIPSLRGIFYMWKYEESACGKMGEERLKNE